MKLRSIMLVTAALAFSATTTAWAQTTGQTAATTASPAAKPKKGDPNEVVCQKIGELGSRLVTKRVCMTRAEWAEQQRQDRMDVEKAQTARPCNASGGC